MTDKITLEEALKLVSFERHKQMGWRVRDVYDNVNGEIFGDIYGNVHGKLYGSVIYGVFPGYAKGTINGRRWQYVETPKEKLQRLLDEVSEGELLKLINQLEDN